MHRAERETRKRMRNDPVLGSLQRAPFEEIDLQVGSFQSRIGPGEQAGMDSTAAQRSFAEPAIACRRNDLAWPTVLQIVQCDRFRTAATEVGIEMIVQIAAHRRHVAHYWHTHRLEMIHWAKSG